MNETSRQHLNSIAPEQARYIKLGPNNAWAPQALTNGRIEFGHADVSHALANKGQWDEVKRCWEGKTSASKASDFLREVKDFYTLGEECLWITFAQGRMFWAFAAPQVTLNTQSSTSIGSRYRDVVDGWRCTDIYGRELIFEDISTKLTKTAAYRQTLCNIKAEDYAIRLINGEEEPSVIEAKAARAAYINALLPIIQSLHQSDFEVLTDLLFSKLGWVRINGLGGHQKDTDLVLEQPATGSRALVQVKSAANQAVLDDYAERFSRIPNDIAIVVCHSPRGKLTPPANLKLWDGPLLAERVVQAGLADWVFKRAG